jgi:NADPH2:quinone reductase
MKAWKITRNGEPRDVVERVDCPRPEPAPNEVRIRVEAAALGLPDVFMCRGSYTFRPELPFTPGQEVCGVVTATGEQAQTPMGARVMAVTSFFRGYGGFAEEALALDAATYPAPDEIDAGEAACFAIPYHTAYLGLVTRGQLREGEWLLVLGAAGGTGAAAISLGLALGARVIAVAGGAAKVDFCRALGAQVVVDHQREDIAAAVKSATSGAGADVIYDPVGGAVFETATHCIASEGRLLAVGFASGEWRDASTARMVMKNASVVGVYVGAYGKPFTSQVHEELLTLWRKGKISSLLTRRVDFEEIAEALEALANRQASGKLVACLAQPAAPGGEPGASE